MKYVAFVLIVSAVGFVLPASAQTTITYGETIETSLDESDPRELPYFNREEFWFDAAAGDAVEIRATSMAMDPYVYLYPAGGMNAGELASDDDGGGGLNSLLRYTIANAGRYLIVVSSYDYGAYSLSLQRTGTAADAPLPPPPPPAPEEPLFSAEQLQPLGYGQSVNGELSDQDPDAAGTVYDLYAFTGRAGDVAEISMTGAEGTATILDTFLRLVPAGDSDTVLAEDDDGGGGLNSEITFTLPTDGEYWIIASTVYQSVVGPYTLRLDREDPGEAAASVLPVPILPGQTVSGELTGRDLTDSGDASYDVYTFSASAGQQLHFVMRSTDFDSYLGLYAADAPDEPLVLDDDGAGAPDADLKYVVPEAGDFILRATSFGAGSRGVYTVEMAP
jgi:hypothetical protein